MEDLWNTVQPRFTINITLIVRTIQCYNRWIIEGAYIIFHKQGRENENIAEYLHEIYVENFFLKLFNFLYKQKFNLYVNNQ